METLYTIILFFILVAAIGIPYWRKTLKDHKNDTTKYEKNTKAGLTKAVTLHPHIDLLKCIGCSSCVQICPEDVLGMVKGRAAILNGVKCVGHGLCEDVCPVGAITLAFGTPTQGMEIPYYNERFESNISGLYIVGELGGIGLIKNAMSHGQTAVHDIVARMRGKRDHQYDIIIIGAGPAGISAALAAQDQGLRYVVLEQDEVGGSLLHYPRKKLILTSPVDLPLYGKLKVSEISKEEMLDLWQSIIRRFRLNIQTDSKVDSVVKKGNSFEVTSNNTTFSSSNVILAIGRRGSPRKLGVSGENLSKVAYKLIEAESYKNNSVVVVGGGDSAVEAAIALASQPGNIVTMSYRRDEFVRLKDKNERRIQEMMQLGKIHVLFNSSVLDIKPESVLIAQGEKVIHTLPNNFVFIFAGGELPGEFLKKIGIRLRTDEVNVQAA